jgi:hypothetical protein
MFGPVGFWSQQWFPASLFVGPHAQASIKFSCCYLLFTSFYMARRTGNYFTTQNVSTSPQLQIDYPDYSWLNDIQESSTDRRCRARRSKIFTYAFMDKPFTKYAQRINNCFLGPAWPCGALSKRFRFSRQNGHLNMQFLL